MRQIALLLVVVFLLFVQTLSAEQAPPGLDAAVRAHVEKKGYHDLPPFRYSLSDLDGDGHADAIVLLQGNTWCGSGGCTMLVFRSTRDGFRFVSGSTITTEPIRVSTAKSHGWRTLIVYSRGKGDVLMRFNGTRYPLNPSAQPKATPAQIDLAHIVME